MSVKENEETGHNIANNGKLHESTLKQRFFLKQAKFPSVITDQVTQTR